MRNPESSPAEFIAQEAKSQNSEITAEQEQEAKLDSGAFERKRVEISPDEDPKSIMKKYDVSRTTAWRARKNGYLFMNYHKRVVMEDPNWAVENTDALLNDAHVGALMALRKKALAQEDIQPLSLDDLKSTASVRLLELAGHPERESEGWRRTVAMNAALTLLKSHSTGEKYIKRRSPEVLEKNNRERDK